MELNGTYSGTLDWKGLEVCYTVDVTCDYYYHPGRMYLPNGDPGYPDEEEYDDKSVVDIDEVVVYNDLGDEVTEKYADNEELKKAIMEDADNNQDDWYWDEPDYDYDDNEPDYEYEED